MQFPNDGLDTAFARLGSAAGVFPSACKAFFGSAASHKQISFAVMDPNTNHKPIFSRIPGCASFMDTTGQIPLTIVNVIKLHGLLPLFLFYYSIPQ
jgi:hypothetical protein